MRTSAKHKYIVIQLCDISLYYHVRIHTIVGHKYIVIQLCDTSSYYHHVRIRTLLYVYSRVMYYYARIRIYIDHRILLYNYVIYHIILSRKNIQT